MYNNCTHLWWDDIHTNHSIFRPEGFQKFLSEVRIIFFNSNLIFCSIRMNFYVFCWRFVWWLSSIEIKYLVGIFFYFYLFVILQTRHTDCHWKTYRESDVIDLTKEEDATDDDGANNESLLFRLAWELAEQMVRTFKKILVQKFGFLKKVNL